MFTKFWWNLIEYRGNHADPGLRDPASPLLGRVPINASGAKRAARLTHAVFSAPCSVRCDLAPLLHVCGHEGVSTLLGVLRRLFVVDQVMPEEVRARRGQGVGLRLASEVARASIERPSNLGPDGTRTVVAPSGPWTAACHRPTCAVVRLCLMAAIKRAKDAGYETIDLGADLEGEAREIAAETKIGVEKKLPKAKGNAGPGRGKAGAKAGRAFDDAPTQKELGIEARRAGGQAGGDAGANSPPAATHDANASNPPMQTTAITIRPLIMVNVSSSILIIRHLIET